MSNLKLNDYKAIIEDLKNNIVLTKLEDDLNLNKIKRKNFMTSEFYKTIGNGKLFVSREFKNVNGRLANFIEVLLKEECKDNFSPKFLTLRDIHKNLSFRYSLFIYPVIYMIPFYFIFRGSNIKKMLYLRFLFIVPVVLLHQQLREYIKVYVTHREAITMLYCVNKIYKLHKHENKYLTSVSERYEKFMEENKLCFKDVKLIEGDKQIKI